MEICLCPQNPPTSCHFSRLVVTVNCMIHRADHMYRCSHCITKLLLFVLHFIQPQEEMHPLHFTHSNYFRSVVELLPLVKDNERRIHN